MDKLVDETVLDAFQEEMTEAIKKESDKEFKSHLQAFKKQFKKVISKDAISFKEVSKIVEKQKQNTLNFIDQSNEKEILKSYQKNLVAQIDFLLLNNELYKLKDENKSYGDVLLASTLELLRINISGELFEEFKYPESDTYQLIEEDDNISHFYREVILEQLSNPYNEGQDEISNFTNTQILHIGGYLKQVFNNKKLRSEDRLTLFLEEHIWLYQLPFFNEKPSNKHSQNIKLTFCTKKASDFYFEQLKYFKNAKNSNHSYFFFLVQKAFDVNLFYLKDNHYIVSRLDENIDKHKIEYDPYLDKSEYNQVTIIDKVTGRPLLNNRWSSSIHSCVEAKENLLVRGDSRSLVQVTPQTYFATYQKLSGLSGTTILAKKEFAEKFGLSINYIPSNKKINREELTEKIFLKNEGAIKEICIDALDTYYSNEAPSLIILDSIANCELAYLCINNLYILIERIKLDLYILAKQKKLATKNISVKKFAELFIEYCVEDTITNYNVDRTLFFGWSKWLIKNLGSISKNINELEIIRASEEIPGNHQINIERLQRYGIVEKSINSLKTLEGKTYDTKEKLLSDINLHCEGILNSDIQHILWYSKMPFNNKIRLNDASFFALFFKAFKSFPQRQLNLQMLHGNPDHASQEAQIISQAGNFGSILVSTRVTGRGTDIRLENPEKNPGLHLFILNHQESERHDQQIYGRCGRQGDKGFFRFYSSLESGVFENINQIKGASNILPLFFKAFSLIDPNDAPIYKKVFFNLLTKFYPQANIFDLYKKQISARIRSTQVMYEQLANVRRIRQKKYGDILLEHENSLSSLKKINIHTKDVLDNKKNQALKEKILLFDDKSFLGFIGRLILFGVDQKQVSKIFEYSLISLFLSDVVDFYDFIKQIKSCFAELSKKLEDLDENQKMKYILDTSIVFEKDFYLPFDKIIYDLRQSQRQIWDENQTQSLMLDKLEDKHWRAVLGKIDSENNNSIRKRSLTLYNQYFDLNQSNVDIQNIFIDDREHYKTFQNTSKFISDNFAVINQLIRYGLLKSIYQILTASGDRLFLDFLRFFIAQEFEDHDSDVFATNIEKLIISKFNLPCNTTYLKLMQNND